jgi:hypothetical protein
VRDDTGRQSSLLLVSGVSFVLRCSAPWSIRHTSTGNPPAVRTGSANQEGGPTVRAAPNAIAVSAISLDLIRAHVSLIHRLAERLKGWGKIVIACFGQTLIRSPWNSAAPGQDLYEYFMEEVVGG